ncbi:MAG: tRNA lysidine(34) synthetase TilS [Bacilli bacterium]|nr:tRNA lysidine(34) synthetase TilS [Bacilli bacterium]
MVQFSYKFSPQKNYILACSFGPDSMALFDMLYQAKCHFVVCFVNYHKRKESDMEQKNITAHCKKLGVKLEVLDTKGMKQVGNFQEWARELRYDFFNRVYKKYHAAGVFVAHHQDDLIETFLMQKMRKGHVKEYGLNETSMLRNMIVIRPLLMYTKQDLLDYCREHQVPYSIDMSNFETKYLRNQIRRNVINRLTEIDRENILKEIHDLNMEQEEFVSGIEKKIRIANELEIRELIALDRDEFAEVIIQFVNSNSPKHVDISAGRIQEIRKLCLSQSPNIEMPLTKGVSLVKEYDIITLGVDEIDNFKAYSYILKKPGKLSTPEFDVDFTHGAEERKIFPEDYPIKIRSPKPGDTVEIGHHICELRRVFIDWKVPTKYRKVWPVFCNKKGKVIYVPRYRKTFVDNHKSTFVIKFTNTKEIKNNG